VPKLSYSRGPRKRHSSRAIPRNWSVRHPATIGSTKSKRTVARGFLYADHLEADAEDIYRHACKMGLEGIVSKRRDSPYRSGRQQAWLKIKCSKSGTFPIIAFVEKLGARPRRVASFYIGRWDNGRLLYAGKVQSGFTQQEARAIREQFDPITRGASPLHRPIRKPKATWASPQIEAEVAYSSLTEDGLLREPVYKGLRNDLQAPTPYGESRRARRPLRACRGRISCNSCPVRRHRVRGSLRPTGVRSHSGR
jgi:ATP-dependent DNA ligase